jgi:hypothetical protein
VIAVLKIREEPCYRRNAFQSGLRSLGFNIVPHGVARGPDDWLIQWNRKPPDEPMAAAWEAAGGTVLVCENGYLGRDAEGRQLYAISVHGHNGSGWFPVGREDRFGALGIKMAPFREDGTHILICAQRGIGSKQMASPPNWHMSAVDRLKRATKRPLRIRLHPGNHAPSTPLETDLEDAHACVIWSSSSGVKALTMGVPVLYDAPRWIAEPAARPLVYISNLLRSEARREEAMHRMSWGQWTVAEIESGLPFQLIRDHLKEATW